MRRLLRRRSAPALTPDALGKVELRAGDARVVIIPALGGKIATLSLGGRDWLWANPAIPYRLPEPAAPYAERADSGGWDECFPTVAPCRIPAEVARWGGMELPDHGELWGMRPAVAVESRGDGGATATCTWSGRRLPYVFERAVALTGDGEVRCRYAVTNTGDAPLPFLWSAHPLFPLTPRTRLHLPAGATVRVGSVHGRLRVDLSAATHAWPALRVEKGTADLARPDAVARRYACKLFVTLPPGAPATLALEEGEHRLRLTLDPAEVPVVGLWLNRAGWRPAGVRGAYRHLGLEPCLGAPDALADALGGWGGAPWLAPGETRRWGLVWRGASRNEHPTARKTQEVARGR